MTTSREKRWSLAGATALVTGGSKGIGRAIVEELAGFGARVHTCSRNAAELEECRRQWEEEKLAVTVSVCDVSVRAARGKLMETVRESFDGKLDILHTGQYSSRQLQLVQRGAEAGGDGLVTLGDAKPRLDLCRHLPKHLGIALSSPGDGAGGLQQLVQRGAEAGGDGLVARGRHLPKHLLQFAVAVVRALQFSLLKPPRRSALHSSQHRPRVPPARHDASPQDSTPAALSSSAATPRPIAHSWSRAARTPAATARPIPELGRSGRRPRRITPSLPSAAWTPAASGGACPAVEAGRISGGDARWRTSLIRDKDRGQNF